MDGAGVARLLLPTASGEICPPTADGLLGESVETETEVNKVDVENKLLSEWLSCPNVEGEDTRSSESVTAMVRRALTATEGRSRNAGFAVPDLSQSRSNTLLEGSIGRPTLVAL